MEFFFAVAGDGIYRYAGGDSELISIPVGIEFKESFNLKSEANRPVMTYANYVLYLSVWNSETQQREVLYWDRHANLWGEIIGPQINSFFVDIDGSVLFSQDGENKIYTLSNTRTSFDGDEVECFFTTKDSGLKHPRLEKVFREFFAEITPVGKPIFIDWWIDGETDVSTGRAGTFTFQPEANVARWDEVDWDDFEWAEGRDAADTAITWGFPPGARGRNIKFRVRCELAGAFRVRRVGIYYILKPGVSRRGERWAS